ncbi:TetR/AcrR family transcriptional regulator [Nocardia amamiensis]|uniref:TetR/AcrR family transcriptional regulator n=1 Tax=Nocardia amamiensis TaxID=404578 RepID=UPI000832CC65|nr:TetR/AcrR family transcriptional regulator [Nocardia amamiensis]
MPPTSARKRGRPIRVSREAVVAATTQLLITEGLGGFSMRRLAGELGVSTAAIYHHFPTRNALFFAVLSARADELDRPQLPDDPRDRLVTIVVYLIDTLDQLPWVLDILVRGETFGRAAIWILDGFISAANELGASDAEALWMYNVMWRFALGELMTRRAADERRQATSEGQPPPHWTDTATPELLADFPAVVRLLPQWSTAAARYSTAHAARHIIDGLTLAIVDPDQHAETGPDPRPCRP